MSANQDVLYSREMVDSWQHSAKCLAGRKDSCICGLTALQAEVERFRRAFFRLEAKGTLTYGAMASVPRARISGGSR